MNKLKYFLALSSLILTMQSCSVLGLIQSRKEVQGDYYLALHPEDSEVAYDRSINVIQGIAAFENGWFTSQTSASKYLLINYLDEKGKSVFNTLILVNSHAQDLSLEQISDNELYLYTTVGPFDKKGASGLLRLKVTLPEKHDGKRDMSKMTITLDRKYDMNLTNSTPTLSEDKKYFAIRSANKILVFNKTDVLQENYKNPVAKFPLDASQLLDGTTHLWFQGIAMKDNLIYCMTGNNSVDSPKYLYVYSMQGKVVKKYNIDKNDFAKKVGHKYEPEGITFIGDTLYYTIMTKAKTGGNKKYLYKLKL